mmetsp:Transcript_89215/g.237117  ORF Transcript_89215/g.237117 Transcript_89215/m.237117 type:complete len:210 (+) Transcript_89215:527-1156(+)
MTTAASSAGWSRHLRAAPPRCSRTRRSPSPTLPRSAPASLAPPPTRSSRMCRSTFRSSRSTSRPRCAAPSSTTRWARPPPTPTWATPSPTPLPSKRRSGGTTARWTHPSSRCLQSSRRGSSRSVAHSRAPRCARSSAGRRAQETRPPTHPVRWGCPRCTCAAAQTLQSCATVRTRSRPQTTAQRPSTRTLRWTAATTSCRAPSRTRQRR